MASCAWQGIRALSRIPLNVDTPTKVTDEAFGASQGLVQATPPSRNPYKLSSQYPIQKSRQSFIPR